VTTLALLACATDRTLGQALSMPLLDLTPAAVSIQPPLESPADAAPVKRTEFASEGTWWWSAGAGVGSDFDAVTDGTLFGTIGYFVVEGVEVQGELGLWYFSQDEGDAVGISPILNFRWHFLRRESWTLYADVGIGFLASTDDVPDGGSSFNFSPRAGVGWTGAIDDAGTRLLIGVRWQHFSNARIFGDDENPALDEPMLYAGVIFPF